MNLINVVSKFKTEDECVDHLIALRWPNGVCCISCGEQNVQEMRIAASHRKNGKLIPARRLFRCLRPECEGYQFTAKAGTIFDSSHLPLHKWFMAIGLIVEARKGMSAKQIARHLGMEKSYKTVWYLCHRIREAMKDGEFLLSGEVEADTTFIQGKTKRRNWRERKPRSTDCVMGMIERGGRLKLVPVKDEKITILQPVLEQHISPDVTTVYTDEHVSYPIALRPKFDGKHKTINHSRTYGIGDTHTNTIENAFSLLKRGLFGTYHKVSVKHLPRYCSEFSFRFNRRDEQAQLFDSTIKGLVHSEALRFKTLTASE
jgi:transposase-like protein